MKLGIFFVRHVAHAGKLAKRVRSSAGKLQSWIVSFAGDGLGQVRALKFDQVLSFDA